ncbi:DNA ligase, partial [candidate division WWE3 bacterium]|nr:DNA ligase [candidate division WWE3 bacterium]
GVEEKSQEIPLRAFIFDVLYLDGVDLISVGAQERFEKLSALPFDDNTLSLTRHTIVNELSEFRKLFDQYVSEGLEGIMCKKLDSEYQAGSRNYNWVKYKRATERELSDTIDAVIMGYYAGRGQRAKFGVGAFLIGLIDPDSGKIQTLAKVGTGLSDDDWISLKKEMDMYQVVEMPATYSVHPNLTPDVWIRPALVVEVGADEITKSPIHTAAQNIIQEKDFEGGLALRFPRFKKLRQDRTGIDTTTTEELANMFKMQNEK